MFYGYFKLVSACVFLCGISSMQSFGTESIPYGYPAEFSIGSKHFPGPRMSAEQEITVDWSKNVEDADLKEIAKDPLAYIPRSSESLDLSSDALTDKSINSIATILQYLRASLKCLKIKNTHITEKSKEKLKEFLSKNFPVLDVIDLN